MNPTIINPAKTVCPIIKNSIIKNKKEIQNTIKIPLVKLPVIVIAFIFPICYYLLIPFMNLELDFFLKNGSYEGDVSTLYGCNSHPQLFLPNPQTIWVF